MWTAGINQQDASGPLLLQERRNTRFPTQGHLCPVDLRLVLRTLKTSLCKEVSSHLHRLYMYVATKQHTSAFTLACSADLGTSTPVPQGSHLPQWCTHVAS